MSHPLHCYQACSPFCGVVAAGERVLLVAAAFPPYHQFDGQLSAISYQLVIYELLPEVFVLIRMMILAALVGHLSNLEMASVTRD